MPVENSSNISEEVVSAFTDTPRKKEKSLQVMTVLGIIGAIIGIGGVIYAFVKSAPDVAELNFPEIGASKEDNNIYSNLTGLPVASEAEVTAPAYCVQVPNGLDGARPQAGLDDAGVIFEAIAERGITRFAAIFQNPTVSVIGPIRSLRMYYLEWDTPFDCTITHAGGADDALAAVSSGSYSDLTENYTYMYRSSAGSRLWNNLFTTSTELKNFSSNTSKTTSNINGFTHMTPSEALHDRVDKTMDKLDITEPEQGNTSDYQPTTTHIDLSFASAASYNVVYNYNTETNSYDRAYENGSAHEIYSCPDGDYGEVSPESACTLTTLAPKVVVAIEVSEKTASDGYHESITTIGSGKAYIFQNGTATEGTWRKSSASDQIRFYDDSGAEIKLVPGQVIVSAVPTYGSINYE